ncbi:MAG TPA: DUF2795 domain-containing protein [Chloroflexota bacterium]|jgi:hypothetical protein|nr:DUF2795 domain-containing protein [Chloroflexota bacterium]
MPDPLHAPVSEVIKYLHGLSFPCEKRDLEEQAKKNHAPQDVIRAIEIMYPEKFTSLDDVSRNLESSEKRSAERAHKHEHQRRA